MIPEILYEDNHLLVANKPAGLLTQADISRTPSLLDIIKQHIKDRDSKPGNVFLGLVQRLDKPVSGVIFFAKTSKLPQTFQTDTGEKGEKYYLAVTENRGTLLPTHTWLTHEHMLIRKHDITLVSKEPKYGQQAILKQYIFHRDKKTSLSLIQLVTGRKHQIRAQLNYLSSPIIGDSRYGSSIKYKKNAIALHAYCCTMKQPVSQQEITCIAPPPESLIMANRLNAQSLQTKLDRALIKTKILPFNS